MWALALPMHHAAPTIPKCIPKPEASLMAALLIALPIILPLRYSPIKDMRSLTLELYKRLNKDKTDNKLYILKKCGSPWVCSASLEQVLLLILTHIGVGSIISFP